MPWLKRGNQLYFYRSVQVNGRPTASYVGRGAAALQLAGEIETRRQVRLDQHALEERQDAAVQPLLDLSRLAELLLETTLLAEGFHYYQRHWRRKRVYRNRTPDQ